MPAAKGKPPDYSRWTACRGSRVFFCGVNRPPTQHRSLGVPAVSAAGPGAVNMVRSTPTARPETGSGLEDGRGTHSGLLLYGFVGWTGQRRPVCRGFPSFFCACQSLRIMSSDTIDDLGGGLSPEGRRGGGGGTGEFMEAHVTVYREDGEVRAAQLEVPALNFRRAPEAALVGALRESDADLEGAEEIEVEVGGETLTLQQTGWEIQ